MEATHEDEISPSFSVLALKEDASHLRDREHRAQACPFSSLAPAPSDCASDARTLKGLEQKECPDHRGEIYIRTYIQYLIEDNLRSYLSG